MGDLPRPRNLKKLVLKTMRCEGLMLKMGTVRALSGVRGCR